MPKKFRGTHAGEIPPDIEGETPDEELSCNGIPICIPRSCGADGNEHRFGNAHFSPEGNVSLFPQ